MGSNERRMFFLRDGQLTAPGIAATKETAA
jgi:hypothetical protein